MNHVVYLFWNRNYLLKTLLVFHHIECYKRVAMPKSLFLEFVTWWLDRAYITYEVRPDHYFVEGARGQNELITKLLKGQRYKISYIILYLLCILRQHLFRIRNNKQNITTLFVYLEIEHIRKAWKKSRMFLYVNFANHLF